MRRLTLAVLLAILAVGLGCGPAGADPKGSGPGRVAGRSDSKGTYVDLTSGQVAEMPAGPAEAASASVQIRYEYMMQVACSGSLDNPGRTALCAEAITACDPAPGPMYYVLQRSVAADGRPLSGWLVVGRTCAPASALGVRPSITLADIQRAFAAVPWAALSTGMQPPNNLTLVTVPVFYQVQWAAEGISPGEVVSVDPARMLGYRVDIRPVLVGYTYHFGDGESFGPTPDPGGTYPNGGVTHSYTKAGTYAVRVDATLGAEFRIDGGPWTRIRDTATVTGVPISMSVKTARAVLVTLGLSRVDDGPGRHGRGAAVGAVGQQQR